MTDLIDPWLSERWRQYELIAVGGGYRRTIDDSRRYDAGLISCCRPRQANMWAVSIVTRVLLVCDGCGRTWREDPEPRTSGQPGESGTAQRADAGRAL